MNWDAISAVSESIGALGVIGSLIYVGYQIRQNTLATQRTNARVTASDHARSLLGIQDEETAGIVFRGVEDFHLLTPLEQYRFDLAITVWLEAIEQAFLDHAQGNYPEDLIHVHRIRVPAVIGTPGGRVWWSRRKAWYSQNFRDVVADLLENPPEEIEDAAIGHPPNKSLESDA